MDWEEFCRRYQVERLPNARRRGASEPLPKTRAGQVRCPECAKTFDTATQLRAHRLSHLEDRLKMKEEECPKCGKKVMGKIGLANHIRLAHPEGTYAQGGFTCPHCGVVKKTANWLTRHLTQAAGWYRGPCTAGTPGGVWLGRPPKP